MSKLKTNPVTTWAGILTAIGAVATAVGKALTDGFQASDVTIIGAAIAAAVGLLFAADAPKPAKPGPQQFGGWGKTR